MLVVINGDHFISKHLQFSSNNPFKILFDFIINLNDIAIFPILLIYVALL